MTTVGFRLSDCANTPFETAAPTVEVGSVAAYWRNRKFVTQETVLPQAINPNVPLEKLASLALITDVPFIHNACDVPLTSAFTLYHTPKPNVPALAM